MLDYTLKTAKERAEFVSTHLDQLPTNNPEYLANYIIMAMTAEEKKQRQILTDNRMVTVNKRETSYQGLVSKFENGEDGIYNLIINDKNVLLTPKVSITQQDRENIPALRQLGEAISALEKVAAKASGKRKFKLKKQLIEMRQEQYIIKTLYQNAVTRGSGNIGRGFSIASLDLSENITLDENMEPVSDCRIDFFNHEHISALLCNYSALKEDSYGKFQSDAYYMMLDLDNLIELTLKNDYPLYYKLLIYKIDGRQNIEIQQLLNEEFKIKHSVEYISALWRNKIPKLIAEKAKEEYLLWYFTTQEKGVWKKCSKCGKVKLATNRFFSKNNTAKDHLYSICKECRNRGSAAKRSQS